MALDPVRVAIIAFGYLLFLFGVAYWAERRKDRGRSIISNPLVYALSIAVYCTSWTFYGSVGRASRSGFGFLAVYLGPTLIAFSWWALLRKMIRVARLNHITSIADFVASRYGKSGRIGALVAVIMLVGISPYIGLQLKAVSTTFDILTQFDPGRLLVRETTFRALYLDTAFVVALVLGVFGGMFGARTLDPSERHEGMVAAVALESLVKLTAFLVVGCFVTWGLFDGLADIFSQIAEHPAYSQLLTFGPDPQRSYTAWFSLLYLSIASVMLLPRQFHIMVVENCEEAHVQGAMWMFPLYLFLINLFVVPIAFGGLLLFDAPALADTFVLTIPLRAGRPLLALLAFIGGLSAATGMVVVSSVTLSTMFLNNLAMPVLLKLGWPRNFAPFLIHIKRVGIMGVILLGFGYYELLGERFTLVNIGLLSFGAAAQLAPALVGGLYWRQATARGAAAGLLLGFACWIYMFLVPALCQSGWLPLSLLEEGPWGLGLLRPDAFLGLEGLDVWSHGLFWSFFFNAGGFLAVSLFTRPSAAEDEQTPRFVDALARGQERRPELRMARAPSVGEFEDLLAKFIGPAKAREKIRQFFGGRAHSPHSVLSDDRMLELRGYVERSLAGAVGPAAASQVVERYLTLKGTTFEEIFDVFGAVSLSLEESREELQSRVRELAVLFEASKRVAATLDERQAIESVLDLIASDFGMDCQGVFLLQGGALVPSVARGFSATPSGQPDVHSYVGQAALERRTAFLSDVDLVGTPLPLEVSLNPGLQSFLATPIVHENQVLGVLAAGSTRRKGYFSGKFIEAFEALASELALAISNARLYQEVRELNRTLEEKVRERTRELEAANRNLQELDRLKSEFLANMSHELRTPMNSILGYTQLVLDEVDGPVTEEQRRSLERVEKNARHLLKLINDILDLSKIEAGRMELDLHTFDVGALALEVVEDQRALAQEKGIACRVELAPGGLRLRADPNKIRELLNNLVNNAIKFTDCGEVVVRASPAARGGQDGVEITVADTGVGIPAEQLEAVFEAFVQLDGSTTRTHGGTGLGLSIARKLVELHGGEIRAESRLGEGSCFTVWLPRTGATDRGEA
ncbi:MAG: SpoIIE family protein phosphatase [Deferrisomatales bacterium]